MNHITLQKVDESNFLACFSLKLEAQQEKFVSHPIRSGPGVCILQSVYALCGLPRRSGGRISDGHL